jgi:hypothetical protein
LKLSDIEPATSMLGRLERVQGLMEKSEVLGVKPDSPVGVRAAAAELILEGLHSMDKISRSKNAGSPLPIERRRAPGDVSRLHVGTESIQEAAELT